MATDYPAGWEPRLAAHAAGESPFKFARHKDGAALIAAERQRQVTEEGRTPEHDAGHVKGEMARAASCYALAATAPVWATRLEAGIWPAGWDYKPADAVSMLTRAGALIAAEIDRLIAAGEVPSDGT